MTNTNARPSAARLERNQTYPCAVKGCPHKRKWTLQHCNTHQRRVQQHGHPTVARTRTSDIEPCRRLIHKLLKKNNDAPGRKEAERIMARIINPGEEPYTSKRRGPEYARWMKWMELTRLQRGGVTPRAALEMALAAWRVTEERGGVYPTTRSVMFAIANAVLGMVAFRSVPSFVKTRGITQKSTLRPTAAVLGIVGAAIMAELPRFMAACSIALDTTAKLEREAAASIGNPLVPALSKKARKALAARPATPPPPPPRPGIALGPSLIKKPKPQDVPYVDEDFIS